MFEAISRLFGSDSRVVDKPIDPKLAVAALLVHLAAVDGIAKPEELKAIALALKDYYGLNEAEVKKLIADAKRKDRDAVDLYTFTSTLARISEREKVEIIRMMWQVVYADDSNHELEDNMVWRVAELIGVPSRERMVLRNRERPA